MWLIWLLNQHIIINWIYPRRIVFNSSEEHPWSHSLYTDSIGKWNISHMQGSFTSTVWCHIYHNAKVYYKHHRIIEFITYMAFLHNSTTILAQSAPLNSTLSTVFSVVSKGPISRGWHLFTKEDFLCVFAYPPQTNTSSVFGLQSSPWRATAPRHCLKELQKIMQRTGWQANNYTRSVKPREQHK